jgi:hypothetical protein
MKGLSVIGLQGNKLNGTIPSFLGSLPLKQLALSYNSLTGTIPSSLTSLKELTLLNLFENKLTGLVPPLSVSSDTYSCALDMPDQCRQPYCNHFKCPLPPGSEECVWRSTVQGANHTGVHCE